MALNSDSLGVVLVTASSELEARKIAITLIENKLAVCANVTKVNSFYRWEENININKEWQLTIKTDLNKFDSLVKQIQQIHSYSVPEIIALPIVKGSENYLNWFSESLK